MFAKIKVGLLTFLLVPNDYEYPAPRRSSADVHLSSSSSSNRSWKNSIAAWMLQVKILERRRFNSCCYRDCCLSFLCWLMAVLTVIATSSIIVSSTVGRIIADDADKKINVISSSTTHRRLPICVGNLLDRRTFNSHLIRIKSSSHSDDDNNEDIISRLMTSLRNPDGHRCRLMSYTSGRPIVSCLDALFHHHHHEWLARNHSSNSRTNKFLAARYDDEAAESELIFVFIGDSRIRQQFINFVKIIPNYDHVTQPNPIPLTFHGDIEVRSRILRLRVLFKFRPLVDDHLIHTLNEIAETMSNSPRQAPQFLLLSMAAWHMLREHGADFDLYKKRLALLRPVLAKMSPSMTSNNSIGRIIWLRQYTSVDFYGDNDKSNTLVVSEKIHLYNQAANQLLLISSNNDSNVGIDLWDSSDPFANEYARGCAIIKRYEHWSFNNKEYATAYANCIDYIHMGYSALSQATQLLYNDLCNAHILSMPNNTR